MPRQRVDLGYALSLPERTLCAAAAGTGVEMAVRVVVDLGWRRAGGRLGGPGAHL